MKEILVVYFSKFGNTQLIAEKIASSASEIMGPDADVQLLYSNELSSSSIAQADMVIMGTPTHNMNLPKVVKPVLDGLPRRSMKGIPFAAFDTSYELSWWLRPFTAAKRLARKLKKLGGHRLAPPETFLVTGREGPLFPGELERADRWARSVLEAAD